MRHSPGELAGVINVLGIVVSALEGGLRLSSWKRRQQIGKRVLIGIFLNSKKR